MATLKKIGQILKEQGLIDEAQLDEALKDQTSESRFLGEIFVERGWVKAEELMQCLAKQYKMPFVRLRDLEVDRDIIDKVPLKTVMRYKVMPIQLSKSKLTVATANPQDIRSIDELSLAFHHRYLIELVLSTAEDIQGAIEKHYGMGANTVDEILDKKEKATGKQEEPAEVVEDIEKSDDEASVVKLVNQILLQAHQKNSTDIHFEPYRGMIRLRYRIDGMLKTIETPASMRRLFPAIISRIKVLSNLNLVERRIPQDGRASVKVGDQTLDLRTSVMPTPTGESVVIRLLPSQRLFDLKELGFEDDALEIITEMIEKPHGLFFVTGPTGSGKSTTLYASLSRINSDEKKIITVEDPVECELSGITQIQINPQVGLTFAAGLRSMLRHDPDVMMVGEVRDTETAELAIRVALTGHLVFSTLHTNDAASGVTRLLDMNIDPYVLASSVRCFIAQRLVRKICQNCKTEIPSTHPDLKKMYEGKGCDQCQQTGYAGRTVIYEILTMNTEIRDLVLKRATAEEIHKAAVKAGMKTLHDIGWKKVEQGLTTPEEVHRVSIDEGEA